MNNSDNDNLIDIHSNDVSIIDLDDIPSSSSSSSSGIPSPWNDCPPSVVRTKSSASTESVAPKPARTSKPARKKCLANNKKTIHKEDEMSFTDMSTTSSLPRPDATKGPAGAKENNQPKGTSIRRRKKGQWGGKKKSAPKTTNSSMSHDASLSSAVANTKTKAADADTTKHFHCYLLRSLDPDHPLKTYIGFTTHPQRRIRQHNGILKNAGAHKTKRAGRPWSFVCVVHGFQDKITALQFEWAWQHVDKSLAFREAVGSERAGKMKRRYGPKARLDELRVLVRECLPFSLYALTIYFPERKYHDLYSGLMKRGKDGNPYKKNDDESEAHVPLTNFEICSLENMPVSREVAALKKKKVAERELKKKTGKQKSPTGAESDDSDLSEWLQNVKSVVFEEGNTLSDLDNTDDDEGDDDSDSKCSNLMTIAENGNSSSDDLCKNGADDDNVHSAAEMKFKKETAPVFGNPLEPHPNHKDLDDVSKDFLSLSMDVSVRQYALMDNTEGCDFSTISSAESTSHCSISKDNALVVTRKDCKLPEEKTQQTSTTNNKSGKSTKANMCDVVDLCDSP